MSLFGICNQFFQFISTIKGKMVNRIIKLLKCLQILDKLLQGFHQNYKVELG